MTHIDPDRDLRELFSRMKDEDRAHLPAFRCATTAPAPSRRLLKPAVMAAAAAAIVLATLTLSDYRRTAAERDRARLEMQRRVFARTSWTSPTDFLLDNPTTELLRTVPTFGSARWINVDSTSLYARHRS